MEEAWKCKRTPHQWIITKWIKCWKRSDDKSYIVESTVFRGFGSASHWLHWKAGTIPRKAQDSGWMKAIEGDDRVHTGDVKQGMVISYHRRGWSTNEWVSEWVSKWVSELLVCHRSVKAWLLIEVAICRMRSFQCGSRKFQWSSRLTVTQKQSRLSMDARWRWTEVRFAELGLRTSGSSRQWWVFSRNFASPAGTHTTQRDRHLRSSTSRQWS